MFMVKNNERFCFLTFLLFFSTTLSTSATDISLLETITIPKGAFLSGSSRKEKDYAYKLDEKAYGHEITRQEKWYENEPAIQKLTLPAFEIMKTPVTNAQYAEFMKETSYHSPQVTQSVWKSYGLVHLFKATTPYQWKGNLPPNGRGEHPVVLVSHNDARAYAKWLSKKTGMNWRLPTEIEWEKATRGIDGRYFPWGNQFDPSKLNSHDQGKFGTTKVGKFRQGASPFGMLDGAGQVFEWTNSPDGVNRYIVKGGSWDDKGCGVCRAAARHGRPAKLKHILIGFRLVKQIQ